MRINQLPLQQYNRLEAALKIDVFKDWLPQGTCNIINEPWHEISNNLTF